MGQESLVFVYPEAFDESAIRGAAQLWMPRSIRYGFQARDPNAFGKTFLLLKEAQKLSRKIEATLLRKMSGFHQTYHFEEQRIGGETLEELLGLRFSVDQYFLAAA